MVLKIVAILSLLAVWSDLVQGHIAFSAQHVTRHDGPPQKVYIHYQVHEPSQEHGHKEEHGHKMEQHHKMEHHKKEHKEEHKKPEHKKEEPKKHEHKKEEHKKHEHKEEHKKFIDYFAHPKYEFGYKIEDGHTGDKKSHHEHRDGDTVKGFYELQEPDGTIRKVEYHADKHSGFHATVKHGTHHLVPKHHKHAS